MSVNEVQYSNACSPITVTLLGIDTDCNSSQSRNEHLLILVTPSGIVTDVNDLQQSNSN